MDVLNVASTGIYTMVALIVNFKSSAHKKVNVIAKVSCYSKRSIVMLKLRKEY